MLTNVVGVESSDGQLITEHAIFGGTEVLTARFTGGAPGIFVIRAKSFAAEPTGGGAAAVDTWEVPALGAEGAARVLSSHVEESEGPKLDEAAIVVSGGRGLGQADGYKMIEDLAKLLGGAAGASRAIVDAGWVPYSHQVGQTGKTVKPTIYIAAGISGATQHMVGMKSAKNIIAVNKDQEGADLLDCGPGNRRRRQQGAAQADRGSPAATLKTPPGRQPEGRPPSEPARSPCRRTVGSGLPAG